jgi:hypothetical protein
VTRDRLPCPFRLVDGHGYDGLTLHGIVRHLTNVERSWFREFFAGETGLEFDSSDEDPDGDFRAEGLPMSDLLAA